MDYNPPGSSICGLFQARILEWVAISFASLGASVQSVQSLSRVRLLQPYKSQHARSPCPSPTPGVYSNSCPSSRWCHPAILSSVFPFSSCPQSLPPSEFSNESPLRVKWPKFGVSVLPLVLPMNIQDWFPLGLTGWIFLQSKELSRVFSSTTIWKQLIYVRV